MRWLVFILLIIFATPAVWAANIKVQTIGEAKIVHNDLAAAKIQAQSRARWAAIEEAAQVKVNVSSVVHNAMLLDESVKSEISGSVVDFKVMDEGKDGDTYWVQAAVTVAPDSAKDLMAAFSKNTTIAVYFPAIMTDRSVEESHPFSEKLIEELTVRGFDVVDLSMAGDSAFREALSNAAQKSDMAAVRELASQFMAGSALVGKVRVVDKGDNVGYAKITFSIVDGEVDYRLIGEKDGRRTIIASGSMTGRGQGATPTAAAYALSKNLASRNSPQLAGIVATKLLGDNKKSVRVALVGSHDIHKFSEFREMVKNISWVLNVREVGTDALLVDYPEKTFYLATIINTNGGYTIKSFSDTEILVYSK